MGTVLPFHDPFAGDTKPPGKIRWLSFQDMANMPAAQVDWIVKGLLARGCITSLTSDVRAGKTRFWTEMDRAILEGRPFLGLPTQRTHIILLSEESVITLLQAGRRAHLDGYDWTQIAACCRQDVADIPWPDLVEQACALDQQLGGGGILRVDTLSRFAQLGPDEENDPAAAARALEPLLRAARSGMAVQASRHARKAGGDVATAGRGSGAWGADADILLHLRRIPRLTPNGYEPELSDSSHSRLLEAASRFTETPAQDEPTTIILGTEGYGLLDSSSAKEQRYHQIDESILLFVGSHLGCRKEDVRSTQQIRAKAKVRDERIAHLLLQAKLLEQSVDYKDSAGRSRSRIGLFIGPDA